MKLTREQLGDICLAVTLGLWGSEWEGRGDRPWWELSDREKLSVLNAARSAGEEIIREFHPSSRAKGLHQHLRDRLTLPAISAEEARMRDLLSVALRDKSAPLSGFREAANDSLSAVHYWSDIQKLAVERRLAANELPSLTLLSAMLRKKHEAILKRGKIRNAEEFYLVQEILAQMDFPIDEESRQQLATFAGDFESRRSS